MASLAPQDEATEGAPVARGSPWCCGTSPASGSLREGEHGMQTVLFAQISQEIQDCMMPSVEGIRQ